MRETRDFASMRLLALESGLEDGVYEDFQKAFGYYDGDTLVACAGLKIKGDIHSLECVAVKEELRGRGVGRKLVVMLEDEARRLGASELWVLARAPGFFEKIGYKRAESGVPGGPNLESCKMCKQYLSTCNPCILVKPL